MLSRKKLEWKTEEEIGALWIELSNACVLDIISALFSAISNL